MRYTQRQLKSVQRKKEIIAARKKRDRADRIRMQDMKYRREALLNPLVRVVYC